MKKFELIDITQPKDGYTVYKDYYWLCKEGLPQQALFYKGVYPQCNKVEAILKRGFDLTSVDYFVGAVFIPIAYVKPFE